MKSIGLVIFVLGVVAAAYIGVQNATTVVAFHEESFKNLWTEDIHKLEGSGKLPPGWKDLKAVEVTVTSPKLKPWLEHYKPAFEVKPEGNFKLQVFVDDFQDGSTTGVLIQYSLVDLKSADTVWELGRTLQF